MLLGKDGFLNLVGRTFVIILALSALLILLLLLK